MLLTERKPIANIRKAEPAQQENFISLLNPLKAPRPQLCLFDLFVVKKHNQPKFGNGLWSMTHRGDKYEKFDEKKMLWLLLKIILNHKEIHTMMELYHNPDPDNRGDVILKYLHGEWKINTLASYAGFVDVTRLPEYLRHEI